MESADAIDDSDDEADYTKMDQGNKKGPVGRWDFDTQEEYSSYMSSREALPKSVLSLCVSVLFSFFSGKFIMWQSGRDAGFWVERLLFWSQFRQQPPPPPSPIFSSVAVGWA